MPSGLSADKEMPECRDRAQELQGQQLFTPWCWLGGKKNNQGTADNNHKSRRICRGWAAGPSKARKQRAGFSGPLDEEVCVNKFIPHPKGEAFGTPMWHPAWDGSNSRQIIHGKGCRRVGGRGWSGRRQGKQSHILKEACSNRSSPRLVPVCAQPVMRDGRGCWEGTRVSLGPGLEALIPTGTTMCLSLAHCASLYFFWQLTCFYLRFFCFPSYLFTSNWF